MKNLIKPIQEKHAEKINWAKKYLANKYFVTISIFLVWIIFFDNTSWLVISDLDKEIHKYEEQRDYYKKEFEKNEAFYMQEIAQQIKGKQIAAKKFPFLLKENIVFPPHLNLEQASSESTAKEKAENLSGRTFLDLTCGFGIDAYFLSQNFSEVTLLEQNKDLLEIVQHNWELSAEKRILSTKI